MLETLQNEAIADQPDRSALQLIRHLIEQGEPVILTVNGKAHVRVADTAACQQLLELVDRSETIEAIREGIAFVDRGEGRPSEEVFEAIRRKSRAAREA